MIRNSFLRIAALAFSAIVIFSSCRKRTDISLPDNLVVFTATEQGMTAAENFILVKVKLSRGTDQEIPVTIQLTPDGVTYATDFTTTPAVTSTVPSTPTPLTLNLVIPAGNNEASFTVTKVPGAIFDGDEKITFDIYSSGKPVLIGSGKRFVLKFAELVSTSSSLTIDGGGATYPNKVFIDLSANRQTAVPRSNWDLGFYTAAGTDSFRVILNSSVGMMAKQINKNDLNAVTATDTLGFINDVAYSPFAPVPAQMAYVDYPNGDITRTALGLISATATDNKVFIVNRGAGAGSPAPARGWKKIRILRNATGGYTLQHADIGATTFTSIDVAKEDAYFFKYISFETGAVTVEPTKKKWDLAWTYFGNVTNFGGGEVPYLFQDFVLQNRNVLVAKMLTTTKAYDSFVEANLTDGTVTSWNSSQTSIGADWRRTTPSPAQTYDDRYYIIKDGDNNYYKVKFTALTNGGVRGFPSVEYALVKRG
jgi:hypothetical protein